MSIFITQLIVQLIGYDIGIYITAKGICVDRVDRERPNKLIKLLFSEYKKKTKIQISILIINSVSILASFISKTIEVSAEDATFFALVRKFIELLCNNVIGLVILAVLTALFMFISYKSVRVETIQFDTDGNRNLSASEIDREYVNFSKSDCIDGHSTLLLIAGDLSFLGDIPDIHEFKKRRKSKCSKKLSDNSFRKSCCTTSCPYDGKCMEQSEQFVQLFDLKKKEITLHIISQEPNNKTDIPYKQRLGRLKEIFSDNFEVRFLPKDTLGNGICVLGRIKVNGGIQELFWHWKNTNKSGTYTAPKTKKADSSENKTLIYLLGTMLWDSAQKASQEDLDNYVQLYKGAIEITNIQENTGA